MMLQALIHYAEREGLGDADFEATSVRWLVPLTRAGNLAGGPIPCIEDADAKKPRAKQMLRPFTSANELNQGTKSHFLCDTLERAALLPDPAAPEKSKARQVQHAYFKALLAEGAAACPSESERLAAVLTFLGNPEALTSLHTQLLLLKAKPSDNAAFLVDGVSLLESAGLREFWRKRRRQTTETQAPRTPRVCLATGQLAQTLDTTEKVKGVPGGLAMGTNLISFDKDAFCSFGLEQAQNAALSAAAELKIRSALNRLISGGLPVPGSVCLHWTRDRVVEDPFDLLAAPDEKAVAALLESVRKGRGPVKFDANKYYALNLSGNGARIVVRSWLVSTVPEVQKNIADWFSDLGLTAEDGSGVRHDFKFGALLFAMVRSELGELPPQIPSQLLQCALAGRSLPLPQSVLAAALRRQQLDSDNKLLAARLALIKACLLRPPSRSPSNLTTKDQTMNECLNAETRDAAYLCGRLFAVFDRLQYLAQGGVNAGVVERYYASASTTPALVMGRLFRNAQFHLAKSAGGVAGNTTKEFEAITSALGEQFPATLDLEGQGRFALGYYHQKAEYRRRAAERKETESRISE